MLRLGSTSAVSFRSGKFSNGVKARKAMASIVAAIAVMECTAKVKATTVTSTWTGTTSTAWNNAANWNPNTNFPSNGNGGVSDYDVIIPAETNQPTLNVTSTIDSATLNSSATLSVQGGSSLTLNPAAEVDNGTIILNSNNSSSSTLDFVNDTLTGTGGISLNSAGTAADVAGVLTLGSTNNISGLGEITAALTNNGTINANVSGSALTLTSATMTNGNLMEATGSGILSISGVTLIQTGSSALDAAGGTVELVNGSTISGGVLKSASGSVIEAVSSSLITLTASVTNNSTFDIQGSSDVNVTGNLTDNGLITINSNNSSTSTMTFTTSTLSGTGTISMASAGTGAVLAGTLTQASGHTINGVGDITANLTNNGLVDATGSNTLFVEGASATNTSTMEATSSVLEFTGGVSVTNTGGTISANGDDVFLVGATITSGTLVSPNGAVEAVGSSLDTLVSVTNNSTFDIQGASNLNVTGNLTDNGSITINSNNSSVSTMTFSGGTLSGTGTITLNSANTSAVLAGTLTQSSGHTINGFGDITANLTNNGLVDASIGNTLFVEGTNATNTSTMEATSGVLALTNSVVVNNAGGTILANGANVVLATATVDGGTLKAISPNVIYVETATLNGSTITANTTVDVVGGFNLTLTGSTLTNNGSIELNYDNASSSTLQVNSNVLLTGSGTLSLDSSTTNAVIATGAGETLTQDVNHTINGLGEIVGSFTNNGTVDANVSGQVLQLLTSNMTNNSLMEATGSGVLVINGITLTQGVSGQLSAAGGSIELVGGATVSAGKLNSSLGGVIFATSSSTDTLAGVTNNSTFDIVGGSNLNVTGNLVDNGSITVNSNNSSVSTMTFSGGTLSGTGTITLGSSSTGAVLAGTFTQSSGHTINGLGEITADLTNNGLVNANVASGTLFVNGTSMTNSSTMEATSGVLEFTGGVSVTNTSGTISANGDDVFLASATVTGGTLVSPNGVIEAVGSSLDTLAGVTNNATFDIQGASNLNVTGNLVDNGSITINSTNASSSTMTFSGGTLSGTGTITLASSGGGAILAGTLTQSSGHTINGLGEITANLTNKGLVNANVAGNTLFVNGTSMSNSATMEATTGVLAFTSGVIVNNAGGVISANGGVVNLTGSTINGGTLNTSSGGVIQAVNSSSDTLGAVTNNGTFNIQGSSNVSTTGTTTNNGTITIDSNNSSTSTLSAGGVINGTGTVSIPSGGLLAFATSVGGSTMGGLSISGNGRLDLNNNHLFINYGSGPDPIASIETLVKSGYNGGAWNGNGIFSSAAAANNAVVGNLLYGLGYADSADSGNPAGLATDQIEIKYTLLGDANLSGVVDGIDFGILAANFNKGVTGWDQGDFNYNNVVDGSDFGFLAANFNKGASGASVGEPAIDDPAIVAFAQANGLMADLISVPEPTVSGIVLTGAWMCLVKRSRRPGGLARH
jgi:fibronectin-binding autotransporter adhesin